MICTIFYLINTLGAHRFKHSISSFENSVDNDQSWLHMKPADLDLHCFNNTMNPRKGVLSFFSSYVGLDPPSTVYPKKYQEYQPPQKNI